MSRILKMDKANVGKIVEQLQLYWVKYKMVQLVLEKFWKLLVI